MIRAFLLIGVMAMPLTAAGAELLVEAESFADYGGWVLDPQFLDVMGSPYLLAHGLGRPVAAAKTTVTIPEPGTYRIWVRTKDWVPSHHPGTFQLRINGQTVGGVLGAHGGDWEWRDAETLELKQGTATFELTDLTGFDGRCDAIFLSTDARVHPPEKADGQMAAWRRRLSGLPEVPPLAGRFDVVVVGGGIPGCAAALAAARLGGHVALIQNRPVLGGNASPEIGITPRGENRSIVGELAGPDREEVLRAEKRLDLYLGWHAFRVSCKGPLITNVDARNTATNKELRFAATVFIDCTGVGAVGFLAGADYRLGREARSEFDESLAPEKADRMHHGNTVVFRTTMRATPVTFPEVPWAVAVAGDFAELGGQVANGHDNVGGLTHFWEYGQWLDPFQDAETIRDHLLCALYGTFSNVKRRYAKAAANLDLDWVGYVPAGGESRRLMGNYILTENDIRSQREFPDAVATCRGHFCLHYPGKKYDFRLGDWKWIEVKPYSVPFRCLFSRNVDNLMMAGKHISVTHVAGSSTKTMLNGGQTGAATGAAAYLCRKYNARPRDVYRDHLPELQALVGEHGPLQRAER